MASKWHQKKNKLAEIQFEKDLLSRPDDTTQEVRGLNDGESELFERKQSKEEKKAAAKAAREAKRKAKQASDDNDNDNDNDNSQQQANVNLHDAASLALEQTKQLAAATTSLAADDGLNHDASDALAASGTICTFASSARLVDARSRDVCVRNVTLQHCGAVLLHETDVTLNHGNRYGLIGRNGCGKSTLLKVLGARALPIPRGIDIFFLSEEVEPSSTLTALDAVMSVDEERLALERQAEDLNHILAELANKEADGENVEDGDGKTFEEQTEEIMESLNMVYERLDAMDASTAEVRARSILRGLGFTHEMQGKLTKDFSGGWRMRVSLARALFIQPVCLLLDEPTNHLDMEAVIWLEDYLSKWNRILLLVSHSQDFLNGVCTHMIDIHQKKLQYYDGNYDSYVKTRDEKLENQWKQYKWEQEQMKSMKDYIARFGHGTSKNAKQAQSKEKVLQKMVRAGLTEKPSEEKPLNFKFADPGHLPPPVLAFHDVSFAYSNCEPLYTRVNLGIDLDSRVALVGPNGAGKTTLIKLMAGELLPSMGDIRPHGHLKLGRFTQHFVDVLDMTLTPLEFFESYYPEDSREDLRKYLGRFGVSGQMQVRKMEEMSDGQKSRVVFAKLGRDCPHILLLDEPTNHLDMESIDALAAAVNDFSGGMILVSHDMRLISQVAKEIWICDNRCITKFKGDIQQFKMTMRDQLEKDHDKDAGKLRGDASTLTKSQDAKAVKPKVTKPASTPAQLPPKTPQVAQQEPSTVAIETLKIDDDAATATTVGASSTGSYVPPHLRNVTSSGGGGAYVPPHLRRKALQEQQS
ncbi:hypothetical protein MPSEU_000052400 [Mayamaea pseudoterrestris]|nr:hypothetical protein MPSEU_000052400 [Mayamaea pseudoterrestris]